MANAFLKLLGRFNRDGDDPKNKRYVEGAEETMCTIQLYGNREEIEAFTKFHETSTKLSTDREYSDSQVDLLEILRNSFRKELDLEDASRFALRWWFDEDPNADVAKKSKRKTRKKPTRKKLS